MKKLTLLLLPLLAIACARQPLPKEIMERVTIVHYDDPVQMEVTRQYMEYLEKIEKETNDPELREAQEREATRNHREFLRKRQEENAKS